LLEEKFRTNLARRFGPDQQSAILAASLDREHFESMPVHEYVDLYEGAI
jgi:2-methylcitrate dehydratase